MNSEDGTQEGSAGGVGLVIDLRDRTDRRTGGPDRPEHSTGAGPPECAQPGVTGVVPWPDASPAVGELVDAVRNLIIEGVLPVGLDAGDRPVHDVAALLRAMAQLESVLAMRMAVAESSGSLPFLSAGGMASQAYWSRGRARALSRAGHLANRRPDIAEAWADGAITAEHVDTAARGVTGLADDRAGAVLDGLGRLWGQVTPATVATYCARARAIVAPPGEDPDERAQKAYESRFLSFSVLDDTIHITGALARLDGELLMNAIHANAQRMRVAGDGPTAAQRRADALVQLAAGAPTGGGGGGRGGGGGGGGGRGGGGARGGGGGAASPARGNASPTGSLEVGGNAAEGSVSSSPLGLVAGTPISMTLTAGLDAVTGSGYHLTPAETKFALCDPTVMAVLVEASSDPPTSVDPRSQRLARLTADSLAAPQPLAVGRALRVATAAQRRALTIRDGGCVLPGCDIPASQCQVHHLVPWTEGGPTDLPNLVTLCWAHHRQVDLGRWDIRPLTECAPGTPANNGAPFTISVRERSRWGLRS